MNTIVILVCSDFEWNIIKRTFRKVELNPSPYGKWFVHPGNGQIHHNVIWFKAGWGKIGSAGSAQYVIDMWHPDLIINIGSCGGFGGKVALHQLVVVKKSVVYDLIDRIGPLGKSIRYHTTNIDLRWLSSGRIMQLQKVVMATGDQDLSPDRLNELNEKYNAVVGDWESGSIAWICKTNKTKLLIIRGVSDLVGTEGNLAYQEDEKDFLKGVNVVMPKLIEMVYDFI